jgi:hypothetical protein
LLTPISANWRIGVNKEEIMTTDKIMVKFGFRNEQPFTILVDTNEEVSLWEEEDKAIMAAIKKFRSSGFTHLIRNIEISKVGKEVKLRRPPRKKKEKSS